ncbi:MAG: 16S rRNA (cytidine(1402)-2'-O)-methyltransferase [Prochlorococcus marinus CUG1439]|uniref:16S rRNA (cytidine(1402)-2'-O)-methyltransferase n=1 Tax=Prochlorococcus sp. MIT 1314 TaxID=3096220 RepID=UPI001B12FDD6|nr:16S rRNA (cytidine(1402)-2'-O)-methyltransferase [Prochlorococcus sp. MIT 1314]MCR8538748.1 16S rRNA (cytidine(1402)-2'-O)-methyltransferase [Prochlorococcus marinus CUG1439]
MKNNYPLSHRSQEPESGVLYMVGTPIGNLNDLSYRAINILKNVSLIACEDTRHTRKIMNKFNITNNLISCNKHNSFSKIPRIIKDLKESKSIALVSDAGMPGICDPGENIAKAVKLQGYDVICVPGPCAALTALISSGMPSSSFIFEGFLPRKKIEREKILTEISNHEKTTIIFESPHRLKKLLRELSEYCGGEREIEISRELTKKFEEHIGNNLKNAISFFEKEEVKGEITIVIKGIAKAKGLDFQESNLKKELKDLLNAGLSLSSASKYLAKKTGIKKSVIYDLS